MTPAARSQLPRVGWREWVRLAGLEDLVVRAKVDTGARTSALHAEDIHVQVTPDGSVATFTVFPHMEDEEGPVRVVAPVVEHRLVRSSNGVEEERPVIRTEMRIGRHVFDANLTLTSRDEMGFRMLLGRSALRRRFIVDPARSFRMGGSAEDPPSFGADVRPVSRR